MGRLAPWASESQETCERGIEFAPVGPLVSYHGLRQPCGCEIAPLLDSLYRKYPAHWQVVTDGGRLA